MSLLRSLLLIYIQYSINISSLRDLKNTFFPLCLLSNGEVPPTAWMCLFFTLLLVRRLVGRDSCLSIGLLGGTSFLIIMETMVQKIFLFLFTKNELRTTNYEIASACPFTRQFVRWAVLSSIGGSACPPLAWPLADWAGLLPVRLPIYPPVC